MTKKKNDVDKILLEQQREEEYQELADERLNEWECAFTERVKSLQCEESREKVTLSLQHTFFPKSNEVSGEL